MKECRKCFKLKLLDDFYRDNRNEYLRRNQCKQCDGKFISKETRCAWCKAWFPQKRKNNRFCHKKCTIRYHNNISNHSVTKKISQLTYRKRHRKQLTQKSIVWYAKNRERALQKIKERRIRRKLLILSYNIQPEL